ncbi:hypothetical protein MRB53_002789 [Persea americana]|uniref:Uncharacterized protein n=1 Tax=Persea americana TaxID=3435 RepID=A0ACC2MVG7_PERAE|nr:hypothetical protein MRB53_002789 [Persea americana]
MTTRCSAPIFLLCSCNAAASLFFSLLVSPPSFTPSHAAPSNTAISAPPSDAGLGKIHASAAASSRLSAFVSRLSPLGFLFSFLPYKHYFVNAFHCLLQNPIAFSCSSLIPSFHLCFCSCFLPRKEDGVDGSVSLSALLGVFC